MTKAELMAAIASYPDDAEIRIRTNRVFSLPIHRVKYGPETTDNWVKIPEPHRWRGKGEFICLDPCQFLAIMD